MTSDERKGGLTLYATGGTWKWTVAGPDGKPLADSAAWRTDQNAAEQDAATVLEALLWSDLPATRIRVAHYLSALDAATRLAIIRNADDIRQSRRQVDRDASDPDDDTPDDGAD